MQRIECHSCKIIRQVKIGFADSKRTYTKSFERHVLDLSKHMTIKSIAKHLKVGWDLIKDIQKRYLNKRFSKPSLKNIENIAIDEICVGKNHKYLSIVLNLTTGRVIFVGEGRGADALVPFWKRLNRLKKEIKYVAIDMSPAYISAVTKNLPGAEIVFDFFHIVKLYNEKLSKLRRQLFNITESIEEKEILKGTRWLLLKNEKNLNSERDEKQRLEKALSINKPLSIAYYLKDDLKQIWKQDSKKSAEECFKAWIKKANSSGIKILKKFAMTLAAHKSGILSYYNSRISTGPLEGTNNKIKTLKRQAYGYRNKDFFKLKIYSIHETKYALVG